jgi:hypothetical protein
MRQLGASAGTRARRAEIRSAFSALCHALLSLHGRELRPARFGGAYRCFEI